MHRLRVHTVFVIRGCRARQGNAIARRALLIALFSFSLSRARGISIEKKESSVKSRRSSHALFTPTENISPAKHWVRL